MFNEKNYIQYKENAYNLSSIEVLNKNIFYQNKYGVKKLSDDNKQQKILGDRDTAGYCNSGILNDLNFYYFLTNEGQKKNRYASQVIVGDNKKQTLIEIDGFVEATGNDGSNIYLLTEEHKNKLFFQRISIDKDLNFKVERKPLNLEGNFYSGTNIIVDESSIYCYAVNDGDGFYILKYSKKTLKLESKVKVFKTDNEDYMCSNANAVFGSDDKIFIVTSIGKVFTYNKLNDEFKLLFSLKEFSKELNSMFTVHYNKSSDDINVIYYGNEQEYIVVSYDLRGNIKNKFNLKLPKSLNELHIHSFKRIK